MQSLNYFRRISWEIWLELWRNLQRTFAGIGKVPLFGAFLIALALANVGQFYEIYLSNAERLYEAQGIWWNKTVVRSVVALVVMGILSATIYISSKSLGRHGIEDAFETSTSSLTDPMLEKWVKTLGIYAALLPWLGLMSGISTAITNAQAHIGAMKAAKAYFDTQLAIAPANLETQIRFGEWLTKYAGWLSWVPSLFLGMLYLALAMLAWHLVPGVARFTRYVIVRRAAKVWPSLGSPNQALHSQPRTGWVDRQIDACHRLWIVQRPEFYRVCGNLLVATVAIATLASIMLPLLLERFFKPPATPYRGFWWNLSTTLTPHSVEVIMPTALGFWGFQVLGIGLLFFMFTVRLQPTRPTWIDRWILGITLLVIPTTLWTVWGFSGWLGVGGVVAFIAGIGALAWRRRKHPSRLERFSVGVYLVLAIVSLVLLCLAIMSGIQEFGWVDVARSVGPLAMALILGLVVFGIVVGLCLVGRHNGIPALVVVLGVAAIVVAKKSDDYGWLALAAPLLFGFIAVSLFYRGRALAGWVTVIIAVVSAFGQFESAERGDKRSAEQVRPIGEAFEAWYAARKAGWEAFAAKQGSKRKFPVFIIAAEGGGIYAAAATSGFLARLQERCPAFAQHVFAISGVSGGAVGSTIFSAAVEPGLRPEGCRDAVELQAVPKDLEGRSNSLQGRVAQVVKDDHLAPLAGLIVSDLFGTFSDRAWGLKSSLNRSIKYHFPSYNADEKFLAHWRPHSAQPALVLNTTWVRVGNRVVFAPFLMPRDGKLSNATLSTFYELETTFNTSNPGNTWKPSLHDITLSEAAVTSARFPGVLAAKEHIGNSGSDKRRWSFVDGGYVDASGAQTAYDIYSAIKVTDTFKNVDVRVIILTGSQSDKEQRGTTKFELRDAIAPVVTLFSVRSLLSRIAVLETLARIETDAKAAADITSLVHASQLPAPTGPPAPQWSITTVELNHDDFKLELGWRLSKLTYDIVSMQLGQADLCENAKPEALAKRDETITANESKKVRPLEVAKTIRANSCVMASVERLLAAKP